MRSRHALTISWEDTFPDRIALDNDLAEENNRSSVSSSANDRRGACVAADRAVAVRMNVRLLDRETPVAQSVRTFML